MKFNLFFRTAKIHCPSHSPLKVILKYKFIAKLVPQHLMKTESAG